MVPRLLFGAGGGTGVIFDDYFSKDATNFRPPAIRAFAKLINDPNMISFAGGSPNPETFPADLSTSSRIFRIPPRV